MQTVPAFDSFAPAPAWLTAVDGHARRLLPAADPEPLGQVLQWMPPPTGGGGGYYDGPVERPADTQNLDWESPNGHTKRGLAVVAETDDPNSRWGADPDFRWAYIEGVCLSDLPTARRFLAVQIALDCPGRRTPTSSCSAAGRTSPTCATSSPRPALSASLG